MYIDPFLSVLNRQQSPKEERIPKISLPEKSMKKPLFLSLTFSLKCPPIILSNEELTLQT